MENKRFKLSINDTNKNIIKEFEKAYDNDKNKQVLKSFKKQLPIVLLFGSIRRQNNTSTYDDAEYELMMQYTNAVNELAEEDNEEESYEDEEESDEEESNTKKRKASGFTKKRKSYGVKKRKTKKSKKQRKIKKKSKKTFRRFA